MTMKKRKKNHDLNQSSYQVSKEENEQEEKSLGLNAWLAQYAVYNNGIGTY